MCKVKKYETVKTDEELLNMEVVDDMIWDFSGQTDTCLDDFRSNIDTDKALIPYDPSSDPYNELIEKCFDSENFYPLNSPLI